MSAHRGHDLRRTFVTLAQVDGARRDLLETISHGPRGDIVSVYTTFPWPALCEEVKKLRISLRESIVLDGDFRTLATRLATTHRKGRNRWRKLVTPPGIENTPNITKRHEDSQSPTENSKPQASSRSLTKRSGSMAAKLAIMASNVLRNYDVDRALDLLEQIRATCDSDAITSGVLKTVK